MNRRGFIQISSVALLPILLGLFPRKGNEEEEYSIEVISNRKFGHKLRESANTELTSQIETDYIIVGGGVAGMAAAMVLDGKDYLLFEGGDRLGGSSASGSWKDTKFAMGAHYELAYPTYFGKELIEALLKMDVLYFNESNQLYQFKDKKYIINPKKAEQCFDGEELYDEVLFEELEGLADFNELLSQFEERMPLPTRLIDKELHYLNQITFKEFLMDNIAVSESLETRINYQMLDDWGAKYDEISAMAGIHYYTCRPYFQQDVELFSPPDGNAYFIEKMVGQLSRVDTIKTSCMVRTVRELEDGVEAEILHKDGTVQLVKAKGLIYAGQKHALKYVMPFAGESFKNEYAPWVVLNIVCKKGLPFDKWQNDVLTDKLEFLGFVSSSQQKTRSEVHDVLTAYYCFDKADRNRLIDIEERPKEFIDATIELIGDVTGTALIDYVKHVNLNIMGHAMPIAKPGYLTLSDVPEYSEKIVFAGVDTGRLPLFSEAFDSGLQAANKLIKNINV